MIPFESQQIIFLAPYDNKSLAIATPAAPAPFITIRISFISFLASFKAFIKAAKVTIAVPCCSSWKTGIPLEENIKFDIVIAYKKNKTITSTTKKVIDFIIKTYKK